MNFKTIFIIFIMLFFVTFSFIIVLSEDLNSIELKKGKNKVELNISEPFYVQSLVILNPSIEAVSYIDQNQTIGYVNIFNGVGENFIIEPNKEYEIIVNGDINLILPTKLG